MHVLNTFTSGNTLEELDKNSRKGSNFNSREFSRKLDFVLENIVKKTVPGKTQSTQ